MNDVTMHFFVVHSTGLKASKMNRIMSSTLYTCNFILREEKHYFRNYYYYFLKSQRELINKNYNYVVDYVIVFRGL